MAAGKTTLEILKELKDNMKLVTDQLSDDKISRTSNGDVQSETVDLSEFWKKFELSSKAVSHEATKISVAFGQLPHPDAVGVASIRHKLETACLSLVSTFYSLTKPFGAVLQTCVRNATISLFEAVTGLVSEIEESHKSPGCRKTQLRYTGEVWEKCSLLEKLPRSNKEAVGNAIEAERGLVADAAQELQEAVKDNDAGEEEDDEPMWRPEELGLVTPCVGLVKTAQVTLKKVREAIFTLGACDAQPIIAELDTICESAKKVSPAVDDFVGTLYPPMQRSNILQMANALNATLGDLLNAVRDSHLCRDVDPSWIKFVTEALEHNFRKVQEAHSHRSG